MNKEKKEQVVFYYNRVLSDKPIVTKYSETGTVVFWNKEEETTLTLTYDGYNLWDGILEDGEVTITDKEDNCILELHNAEILETLSIVSKKTKRDWLEEAKKEYAYYLEDMEEDENNE